MAIDSKDKLVAALVNGQKKDFFKPSQTSEGAGTWHSLWQAAGAPPAGAIPTSYASGTLYIANDETLGAFKFTNPQAPALTNLLQIVCSGSTIEKLVVYDRLWACSGLTTAASGTLTVVTPGALDRPDAVGAGVEAWGEVYVAPGATTATWTLNYLDQDGNAGVSNYVHPANAESIGQMFPWLRASGDTGIQSVASVYFSASSGTAGNIGITLLRRIAEFPIQIANVGDILDAFFLGMPRVYDDACLAFMVMCSATNTGNIQGSFLLGQG